MSGASTARRRGGRKLTCADRSFNRKSSRVRARVEHPFGVIKHLWGYGKVRYRGLAKNGAQVFTLFALWPICTWRVENWRLCRDQSVRMRNRDENGRKIKEMKLNFSVISATTDRI